MGVLANIQAGLKSIPLPGYATGTGNYPYGFNRILPGAQYDYRAEAGLLWDNSVVLAALKWVQDVFTEAPLCAMRKTDGHWDPVDGSQVTEWWDDPCIDYDASTLWAGYIVSIYTDGNAYVYKQRGALGNVVALQYVPHFMIAPAWDQNGRKFIDHYVYRVNGVNYRIPVEDVIHFRDGVDPMNIRRGLPPLGACLREVCTENEAATFAAAILRNFGVPGTIISSKETGVEIQPDQSAEMKRQFREEFTGDRRGGVLISSLPIAIENPGFSPEEMILDKVRAIPVTRICAAMGIDPMVIGLPSDTKTYANYEEAVKAAYYRTIVPLHRRTDKQLTRQATDVLGWVDGDRYGRDYSDVECMKQDYTPMLTPLTQAVGKPWMTPNEARSFINLEKMDGADDLYEEPEPVGAEPGGDTDSNMAQARKLIAASWAQQ